MSKKITELPAAVYADLSDTDTLFEIADTSGVDSSKSVAHGLLRAFLFAGVAGVIALGVNASGADAQASDVHIVAPLSTGNAAPGLVRFAVGVPGASGAAVQTAHDMFTIAPNGAIDEATLDADCDIEFAFGSSYGAPAAVRQTFYNVFAPHSAGNHGLTSLGLILGLFTKSFFISLGGPSPVGVSTSFDDLRFASGAGTVGALSQAGNFAIAGTLTIGLGAVTAGAADSGGAGFKLLRVPN